MSTDKLTLPTLPDHERALIAGAMLLDSYAVVTGIIVADDFSDYRNQLIWSAIEACAAADRPMDMINVRQRLVDRGHLDAAGGDDYLLDIWENAAGPGNAEKYARDIAVRATVRRFVDTLRRCTADAYVGDIDPDAYLAASERAILGAIGDDRTLSGPKHITHFIAEMAQEIQAHSANQKRGVTGLPTGVYDLDRWITGMHPGEVLVVAGRSGMGKSAFMTAMMLAADKSMIDRRTGERDGIVVVFSMEMQGSMVAARAVAGDGGVNLKNMRSSSLTVDERETMNRAAGRVANMAIYVDETPALSIQQISARLRKLSRKHRIALVIVDYLQLMSSAPRESREQAVAESSRGIKRLSKELKCPFVALAQLNRKCEERPSKRPMLSDLRESGSIEQDADVVLLLYRRGYYAALMAEEEKQAKAQAKQYQHRYGRAASDDDAIVPGEDDGMTEIIVAKQRNGPTGVVRCRFEPTSVMFVNIERDYGDDDAF